MQKTVYVVSKGDYNENPETLVRVFLSEWKAKNYCHIYNNMQDEKYYGYWMVEMDWE